MLRISLTLFAIFLLIPVVAQSTLPVLSYREACNLSVTRAEDDGEMSFELQIVGNDLHVSAKSVDAYGYPYVIYYKDSENIIVIYTTLPQIENGNKLESRKSNINYSKMEFDIPGVSEGKYNIFFDSFAHDIPVSMNNHYNFHRYGVNLSKANMVEFKAEILTPRAIMNENLLWTYCYKSKPLSPEYLSYERIILQDENNGDVYYSKSGEFESDSEMIGTLTIENKKLWSTMRKTLLPNNYWQWGKDLFEIAASSKEKYLIFDYLLEDVKYFKDYGKNAFLPFYLADETHFLLDDVNGVIIATNYENHISWIDGVGFTGKIASSLICPSKTMSVDNDDYRQILSVKDVSSGIYRYVNPERHEEFMEFASIPKSDIASSNKPSDLSYRYFSLQGVEINSPKRGDIVIRFDGTLAEKIVF